MPRTYTQGRPTTGWKKGERVTYPRQVKPGDVLIGMSHQFKAENLYLVVQSPDTFNPNAGHGFHVSYTTPDLALTREIPDPQWVWQWQLSWPDHEWFKAEANA